MGIRSSWKAFEDMPNLERFLTHDNRRVLLSCRHFSQSPYFVCPLSIEKTFLKMHITQMVFRSQNLLNFKTVDIKSDQRPPPPKEN